jgi:hypothetical protein
MENQQEQTMTAEQLAERKQEMLTFYKESVPYLEAQLKYEQLLLEIDEARFKRSSISYQFAMMANAGKEMPDVEEDEDDSMSVPVDAPRKLKKQ